MNILINLIIIAFIINFIYRSIKQIEKEKKSQIKSRKKIVYPQKTDNVLKTNRSFIAKESNSKSTKLNRTEIQDSISDENTTSDLGYDLQAEVDTPNFDLVEGIIMSEILAPPLSKRGAFHYRRRK